jgi:prepilin-type N-terminal cleavage/methylation domain-containing protein
MSTRPIIKKKPTAGFTLLEVLMVLALIALIAGVAAPNLKAFFHRLTNNFDQENFLKTLKTLPQQAYTHQTPLTIKSESDLKSIVPDGWNLTVDKPIHYRLDGFCTGGTITLTSPNDLTYAYTLETPHCQPKETQP